VRFAAALASTSDVRPSRDAATLVPMSKAPPPFADRLITAMRAARRVVALTGAGVSAESGVPTFRDAQTGLWADFKPEELATPEAFRANPRRVWEWYAWRRERVRSVQPNAGHIALAVMETRVPHFLLVTQNVDGLHRRAGSRRVVELHGNLERVKCFEDEAPVEDWTESGEVPPLCPRCGGWLRPDVVWFGEMLPEGAFAESVTATEQCEVFLSIGTSTLVQPAADLPRLAQANGALVVEVNPEATPLSAWADVSLRGKAGEILPALVAAVWG
jgi:NAD-dependent deacetylase